MNSDVWAAKRDRALSVCFYTGGCTNLLPYIAAGVVGFLFIAMIALIYAVQRKWGTFFVMNKQCE